MKSGWPSSITSTRAFADAEALDFVIDERVGDVQDVERNFAVAESVGKPEKFERAHGGVIHPALQDDAEILRAIGEKFVQRVVSE